MVFRECARKVACARHSARASAVSREGPEAWCEPSRLIHTSLNARASTCIRPRHCSSPGHGIPRAVVAIQLGLAHRGNGSVLHRQFAERSHRCIRCRQSVPASSHAPQRLERFRIACTRSSWSGNRFSVTAAGPLACDTMNRAHVSKWPPRQ